MKVMAAEHNTPEDVVIPRADKELFKADRSISALYYYLDRSAQYFSLVHDVFQTHSIIKSNPLSPSSCACWTQKHRDNRLWHRFSDPDGQVNLNDLITVHHLPRLWPTLGTPILWGAIVLRGTAPGFIATTLEPASRTTKDALDARPRLSA